MSEEVSKNSGESSLAAEGAMHSGDGRRKNGNEKKEDTVAETYFKMFSDAGSRGKDKRTIKVKEYVPVEPIGDEDDEEDQAFEGSSGSESDDSIGSGQNSKEDENTHDISDNDGNDEVADDTMEDKPEEKADDEVMNTGKRKSSHEREEKRALRPRRTIDSSTQLQSEKNEMTPIRKSQRQTEAIKRKQMEEASRTAGRSSRRESLRISISRPRKTFKGKDHCCHNCGISESVIWHKWPLPLCHRCSVHLRVWKDAPPL